MAITMSYRHLQAFKLSVLGCLFIHLWRGWWDRVPCISGWAQIRYGGRDALEFFILLPLYLSSAGILGLQHHT